MNAEQTVSTRWVFTLDGGGTKCRGVLFDGERIAATGMGQAANVSWGVEAAVESILDAWQQVCAAMNWDPLKMRRDAVLCAGMAGIESPAIRNALLDRLQDFQQPIITTDGYAALVGAMLGKPGSLVIVGTGMALHRLYGDGTSVAIGGWGLITNDNGSAGWIGLCLVRDWLRWQDGVDSPIKGSRLTQDLAERLGRQRHEIFGWITKAKSRDFGALATLVTAAAAQGDQYANTLWLAAVREIAHYIKALQNRSDPKEQAPSGSPMGNMKNMRKPEQAKDSGLVYIAGGLGKQMIEPLWNDHGLRVIPPQHDANHGCLLIARGQAPLEVMIN